MAEEVCELLNRCVSNLERLDEVTDAKDPLGLPVRRSLVTYASNQCNVLMESKLKT